MSYINWEYYNSHFPKVDEDTFLRLQPQAEMKLDIMTFGRAKTFIDEYPEAPTTYQTRVYEQIKSTVCSLINVMKNGEDTGAGTGVTSVSNDGYSESYNNVTQAQADTELRSVAFQWLIGTGLMGAV